MSQLDLRITDVKYLESFQRYLERRRRCGAFTRWHLAVKPNRRPDQWVVIIRGPQ